MSELEFPGAELYMSTEVCRRQSQCRLCDQPIPKGATRFALRRFLVTPRTSIRGGKIFNLKYFFHTECMVNWLQQGVSSFGFGCCDCGTEVETRTHAVYSGKASSPKRLCNTCAKKPHWRYCEICTLHAQRYETSPLIEDGYIVERYACDRCVAERDLLTVKVRKRIRRETREGANR